MFMGIAPVTSAAAAARKTTRTHSTRKSESVKGYRTRTGKRIAPYKRRPAK
jgi:hypothetical protein